MWNKRQIIDYNTIFANHIFNKEIVSRTSKEFSN